MQSIMSLKKYVSEIIGIFFLGFKIFYKDVGLCFGFEEMKYGFKKFYRYKIKDGDEIYVWSC